MVYTVEIKRSAEKEMDRLPAKIHKNVANRILALENNPRPPGSIKLQAAMVIGCVSVTIASSTPSTIKRGVYSSTALRTGAKRIARIAMKNRERRKWKRGEGKEVKWRPRVGAQA